MEYLSLLPVAVAAYLIGSIPTGVILARLLGWPDPRTYGSGHTGALNVSRGAGKGALILVAVLDLFKGMLGVWSGSLISDHVFAISVAGIAVTVGHCWPVWVRFSGGMGLATGFGAVTPYAPLHAVIALAALGVLRFFVIKHSPRAVIVALLTVPATLLIFQVAMPIVVLAVGVSLILGLRHALD